MEPTTTKKERLTLQRLQQFSFGDIYKDIEFAKDFYPEHPKGTSKPQMREVKTAKDAREYANLLEAWEKKDAEYKKALKNYNADKADVESIIEAHIKEMSGFNKIPEGAKVKVWSKAWEDGHSEGYTSVYHCLCGLVDLFDY